MINEKASRLIREALIFMVPQEELNPNHLYHSNQWLTDFHCD